MLNVLRRSWKRYSFEVLFFIFVLVFGIILGLLADRAFGAENPVKMQGQKYEQYIIARPATTTTTTTTQPKKKPVKSVPIAVAPTQNVSLPPGSHVDWMQQAGIAESDWGYVEYIISKESGWRPNAVNPTNCIGLGQNCPDKNGQHWLIIACPNWQSDPVCQLRRFSEYASKYHGWAGSYNYWISHHNW